ncbi:hypothetical protein J5X98_25795 [Leptothermofonsia sichuanensis E412]|uniref:hypothetical protein n=1 Tax=Leptothermofonsia sichuanensis TaxID=2917832 RepID=UPI001CA68F4A|nr:hypothetical protein [Leptothermofonsia sichuanensis]QZZ20603.1 hypothetical protein J5X98_25795 [Leptothermofonsia sichuanensis E412]
MRMTPWGLCCLENTGGHTFPFKIEGLKLFQLKFSPSVYHMYPFNGQGRASFFRRVSDRGHIFAILLTSLVTFSIMTPAALAEIKQIRSTLRPGKDQTFAELMEQAESTAKNLVKQTFARYPRVTEVSVTVLGERNGQETPLLVSSVSRTNWQKFPQIRRWTTYFNNFSISLLGYRKPPEPPAPAPVAVSGGSVPVVPGAPASVPGTPQPAAGGTTPATGTPAPVPSLPATPTGIQFNDNASFKERLKNDPAYRDD